MAVAALPSAVYRTNFGRIFDQQPSVKRPNTLDAQPDDVRLKGKQIRSFHSNKSMIQYQLRSYRLCDEDPMFACNSLASLRPSFR